MRRIATGLVLGAASALLVAVGMLAPGSADLLAAQDRTVSLPAATLAAPASEPVPPPPVMVADVMASGVLIVVSKAAQRMYVFRDGALWGDSPVSTGKRGKATPAGVFAILQKKQFHRSNLYSNAPMPWMQRLTWTGIAIHAGHLPGYPASHGCIRLPAAFARSLYGLTRHASTAVIVVDDAVGTEGEARQLAAATDAAVPMDERFRAERQVMLARAAPRAPRIEPDHVLVMPRAASSAGTRDGPGQTIQLAAATSAGEAQAHWAQLVRTRPELAAMDEAIVPAVVNSRQYYRLRVTAPGAHAMCRDLQRSGISCFAVS